MYWCVVYLIIIAKVVFSTASHNIRNFFSDTTSTALISMDGRSPLNHLFLKRGNLALLTANWQVFLKCASIFASFGPSRNGSN